MEHGKARRDHATRAHGACDWSGLQRLGDDGPATGASTVEPPRFIVSRVKLETSNVKLVELLPKTNWETTPRPASASCPGWGAASLPSGGPHGPCGGQGGARFFWFQSSEPGLNGGLLTPTPPTPQPP